MDTVGNAVLSKLLLRSRGVLDSIENVVVVTSGFHMLRVLGIFRSVFGPSTSLCVIGPAREPDSDRRRVESELRSERLSSESIFRCRNFFETSCVASEPIPPGDESSLFFQMLAFHGLYKHRHDLVRKYEHVLT